MTHRLHLQVFCEGGQIHLVRKADATEPLHHLSPSFLRDSMLSEQASGEDLTVPCCFPQRENGLD